MDNEQDFSGFLNIRVALFFDSGRGIERKQGTIKEINETHITIFEDFSKKDEALLRSRIVRMEAMR